MHRPWEIQPQTGPIPTHPSSNHKACAECLGYFFPLPFLSVCGQARIDKDFSGCAMSAWGPIQVEIRILVPNSVVGIGMGGAAILTKSRKEFKLTAGEEGKALITLLICDFK